MITYLAKIEYSKTVAVVTTTASIGLTEFAGGSSDSVDDLLNRADAALDKGRELKRNRTKVHHPASEPATVS